MIERMVKKDGKVEIIYGNLTKKVVEVKEIEGILNEEGHDIGSIWNSLEYLDNKNVTTLYFGPIGGRLMWAD